MRDIAKRLGLLGPIEPIISKFAPLLVRPPSIDKDSSSKLQTEGTNQVQFRYSDDDWRYLLIGAPEAGCAYSEKWLYDVLHESGLNVKQVHYSTWTGRYNGLSCQDVVIITKLGTNSRGLESA
jgi:transposase